MGKSDWAAHACDLPPPPRGRTFRLASLYHVTHAHIAQRMVEDGQITRGLVYDESRLNVTRRTVVWVSRNTWHNGSRSRRVPVLLDDIEWFGAAGDYVVAHWADREGLLRQPLKTLETGLDSRVFVRIHRSTLVNPALVRETQSLLDSSWKLTMVSGAELVASRTYRDALMARLGRPSDRSS